MRGIGRLIGALSLFKPARGMAGRIGAGVLAGGIYGAFSSMMSDDASFGGSVAKGAVLGGLAGGAFGSVGRNNRAYNLRMTRNLALDPRKIKSPFLPLKHPSIGNGQVLGAWQGPHIPPFNSLPVHGPAPPPRSRRLPRPSKAPHPSPASRGVGNWLAPETANDYPAPTISSIAGML